MARPQITLSCQYCGTAFQWVPCNYNYKRPRRFCSNTCKGRALRRTCIQQITEYLKRFTERDDACWLWDGPVNNQGYGVLSQSAIPRKALAHRAAYEAMHGPIPDGLCVLHRCDVPLCLRHLFLGTQADNMRDMTSKGRGRRGEQRWNAKLTEQQVREIRATTGSLAGISARFCISRRNASDIRRRETWKHID